MADKLAATLALYDASLDPQKWMPALDQLLGPSEAKSILMFGQDATEEYSARAASSMWRPDLVSVMMEWMEKYGHYDAFGREALLSTPRFSTISDEEIWPGEDLWNREDIVEQREALGTFRRVGLNLSAADGITAGMIFHYDDSITTVPRAERELLQSFAPHAAKAIEIHRFHFALMERYRAVLSVLDRVKLGMAVLAGNGEAVVTNDTAREILDRTSAIRLRPDRRIEIADEDSERGFRRIVTAAYGTASEGADVKDALVRIPRGRGEEPLLLEVLPLRDARGEIERDFTGALLYFIDPDVTAELDIGPLAVTFGLSKSERLVCELLVAGHTLAEIAEIRKVSFHTIQSQTRSIYRKTGTRTRGEIVHKAASIRPPVF